VLVTESTDAMVELNHRARAEWHADDEVLVPQRDPLSGALRNA
jgi:hypothetical protein